MRATWFYKQKNDFLSFHLQSRAPRGQWTVGEDWRFCLERIGDFACRGLELNQLCGGENQTVC